MIQVEGNRIGARAARHTDKFPNMVWFEAKKLRKLHDCKNGTTRISLIVGPEKDAPIICELVRATPAEILDAVSKIAPDLKLLVTSTWDIHRWAKEGERTADEDVRLRFERPQHKHELELRARQHARNYARRHHREAFHSPTESDWRVATGIDLFVAAYLAQMAYLDFILR